MQCLDYKIKKAQIAIMAAVRMYGTCIKSVGVSSIHACGSMKKIKRHRLNRHLAMVRLGLKAGSRYGRQRIADIWLSEAQQQRLRASDAEVLSRELGKLKGSIVKIGQLLALYGEHFLPPEVVTALHDLESRTEPLSWPVMEAVLREEWAERDYSDFEIDTEPLAAASLGQVYRAICKATGEEVCIKIQYPGVAQSIDADLDNLATLLKWTTWLKGDAYYAWIEEVRELLHREVDYNQEVKTLQAFHDLVSGSDHYVVPQVFTEWCTERVMVTSFEAGYAVNTDEIQSLSQQRRNQLGRRFLDLFLKEVFCWPLMQTDANFGNYLIHPGECNQGSDDKIVLLDFGAVRTMPNATLEPFRNMIIAAYQLNMEGVTAGAIALGFLDADVPDQVKNDFVAVCSGLIEPLLVGRVDDIPAYALNAAGDYRWRESDLLKRMSKQAARSAASRYFSMPGGDFMLLNRKLAGVFTFISVLGAEFNGADLLEQYL